MRWGLTLLFAVLGCSRSSPKESRAAGKHHPGMFMPMIVAEVDSGAIGFIDSDAHGTFFFDLEAQCRIGPAGVTQGIAGAALRDLLWAEADCAGVPLMRPVDRLDECVELPDAGLIRVAGPVEQVLVRSGWPMVGSACVNFRDPVITFAARTEVAHRSAALAGWLMQKRPDVQVRADERLEDARGDKNAGRR